MSDDRQYFYRYYDDEDFGVVYKFDKEKHDRILKGKVIDVCVSEFANYMSCEDCPAQQICDMKNRDCKVALKQYLCEKLAED